MANFGYSFQPGAPTSDVPMAGRRPSLASPQAVRMLSFRVPDRPSPTAPAPMPLLKSAGGGQAGAGGFQSLIAALMQAFQPQTGRGPSAPGPPQQAPQQAMPGASPLPPLQAEPTFQPDNERPRSMPQIRPDVAPQMDVPQRQEQPFTPHFEFAPPESPDDPQAAIRRLLMQWNTPSPPMGGGGLFGSGMVAPGSDASDWVGVKPLF